MALDDSLQAPFERIFERFIWRAIEDTAPNARKPDEVRWLERFHRGVGEGLHHPLRQEMRDRGIEDSIITQSAFVHGRPLQFRPDPPLAHGVEAGDLLLIGQRIGQDQRVEERQALLLQMKVGAPKLGESSTHEQAFLYGSWPPVTWDSKALRALPGPHPRTPQAGPCRAAQFGIVPESAISASEALELDGPARFGRQRPLAAEMAAVSRLAIGVDATPGPLDGWPRLVEDMLERAAELVYGRRLPRHSAELSGEAEIDGDGDGAFAVVTVSTGPRGILD